MSNKKKIYLILLSFFTLLAYLFIGIFGLIDFNRYKTILFDNSIDLNFHYKYSNKINHLRPSKVNNNTTDYLFNKINNIKSKDKILFLGDSWFQSINDDEYKSSYNSLKEFSQKNKLEIINAGITSFSPSLMQLQYGILKKEFNINPTILVLYIDQTDIGDEICRYKERKVFNKNGYLVAVNRFDFDKEIFNGLKIYEYSKIKLQNNSFIKFIKLSNFSIYYFFKKNFFRINKIIKHGWRTGDNRNYYKCRFKVIKSYLENKNDNADKYFKKTLLKFFDYLNNDKNIKQIIVTTFPHRGHIKGLYQNNVSFHVDEVIKKYDNKFQHLNFSNFSYSDYDLNEFYIISDAASHLAPKFHNEDFIKKIIEKIDY